MADCSQCGTRVRVRVRQRSTKRGYPPRYRCRNAENGTPSRRRQRHYKIRKFGVGPDDIERMRLEQAGQCAICGVVPVETLHIDHDHRTGVVRALLCRSCNLGLGLFGDEPERLSSAVRYLILHSTREISA